MQRHQKTEDKKGPTENKLTGRLKKAWSSLRPYYYRATLFLFITYLIIWVSWGFLIFGSGIPAQINNIPSNIIHYTVTISNVGAILYLAHILTKQFHPGSNRQV